MRVSLGEGLEIAEERWDSLLAFKECLNWYGIHIDQLFFLILG